MDDAGLVDEWLRGTLRRPTTHEEHLRIAFELVRARGREGGVAALQRGTQENSAALGVAERYDEELTARWGAAVADVSDAFASADELLAAHPELLDGGLLGPPRWKRELANRQLVRRLFEAFERKDAFAVRGVFAEDAVWTVGGSSAVAGVYRGRHAIVRFLGTLPRLTGGTYASRVVDVLASGDRAAVLYRATGRREGRELDLDQLLLFTVRVGAVVEVLALPSDQSAFDAFWGS